MKTKRANTKLENYTPDRYNDEKSVEFVDESAKSYFNHLQKFSSEPKVGREYGLFAGEPPSALEVELNRPLEEVLDGLSDGQDLQEYLANLAALEDDRLLGIYAEEEFPDATSK